MTSLDVARWQFGITTVYHFIFVPLTIGLAPLVASFQTAWVITGNERWYRLTKFFGKLLLINFAIGVATGIVQEFQFGMNWSEYSKFIGDVFGAPLALEGIVAFFLESTFLGLWIFGWDRLPKLVHLGTIWMVAIGVNASAFFIIAANSFMQHPVGATFDPERGRPVLTDIWALLTNNTALAAFPHAVAGAFFTAGTFIAGIAGWWLVKTARSGQTEDLGLWRKASRIGMVVIAVSGIALVLTGDIQGKLMFKQQPMKMASAESLCHGGVDPDFSVLTIGTHNNCDSVIHLVEVPGVLSWLAEGQFSGVELGGVVDLQEKYQLKFGPGDYRPNLFVTYWSFRVMMGMAALSAALSLAGLWLTRGGRNPDQKWFAWLSLAAIPAPFLGNIAGWVFTEMGRQPWVVAPNPDGDPRIRLMVQDAVSGHPTTTVVVSLVTFTLLYAVLAALWAGLMRRYVLEGAREKPHVHEDDHELLSFAY
ncbi:MAG: cytochrome ubiquinol oxidase subunit I [Nocardiaceae bacterium]|nr:cytochrome ubiquinol oxidase subunit I [Nocardiaceae bacterium]